MLKAERKIVMQAKMSKRNRKMKAKAKLLLALICVSVVAITVMAKGSQPKVVGYVYDSGSTVWEMAKRHCPKGMDMQDFVSEIEKANGIEDSVIHENWAYKIPVYETELKGEYLDMNTVVGYEATDNGVLLLTNDGNGYFIEK